MTKPSISLEEYLIGIETCPDEMVEVLWYKERKSTHPRLTGEWGVYDHWEIIVQARHYEVREAVDQLDNFAFLTQVRTWNHRFLYNQGVVWMNFARAGKYTKVRFNPYQPPLVHDPLGNTRLIANAISDFSRNYIIANNIEAHARKVQSYDPFVLFKGVVHRKT
jgi:hypothetical protein